MTLPPGPAFIPEPRQWLDWPGEWRHVWARQNVPEGYEWRPATPSTPAGWTRPVGGDRRKHGFQALPPRRDWDREIAISFGSIAARLQQVQA